MCPATGVRGRKCVSFTESTVLWRIERVLTATCLTCHLNVTCGIFYDIRPIHIRVIGTSQEMETDVSAPGPKIISIQFT